MAFSILENSLSDGKPPCRILFDIANKTKYLLEY